MDIIFYLSIVICIISSFFAILEFFFFNVKDNMIKLKRLKAIQFEQSKKIQDYATSDNTNESFGETLLLSGTETELLVEQEKNVSPSDKLSNSERDIGTDVISTAELENYLNRVKNGTGIISGIIKEHDKALANDGEKSRGLDHSKEESYATEILNDIRQKECDPDVTAIFEEAGADDNMADTAGEVPQSKSDNLKVTDAFNKSHPDANDDATEIFNDISQEECDPDVTAIFEEAGADDNMADTAGEVPQSKSDDLKVTDAFNEFQFDDGNLNDDATEIFNDISQEECDPDVTAIFEEAEPDDNMADTAGEVPQSKSDNPKVTDPFNESQLETNDDATGIFNDISQDESDPDVTAIFEEAEPDDNMTDTAGEVSQSKSDDPKVTDTFNKSHPDANDDATEILNDISQEECDPDITAIFEEEETLEP